jgi:hypothetical protein
MNIHALIVQVAGNLVGCSFFEIDLLAAISGLAIISIMEK